MRTRIDRAAQAELELLPTILREAMRDAVNETEATVAVTGNTSSLVADRYVICIARGGRHGPTVQCLPFRDVAAVDAASRIGGVTVRLALVRGPALVVLVPSARAESAFQAATILNLLVALAHKVEPVVIEP